MAKYLFLFRGGMPAPQSPEEAQKQMQKWGTWIQALTQKGHFKAGEPLEATSGKVVRGKKKTVTDGPYIEAKDLVGGYLLITAESLDHAVELSKGCPIFEHDEGTVEVRVVHEMAM
jgi:hypothetical protein